MVSTNSAIYSHHVPSRCTTLDLVAPLRHPCARLTDLETYFLEARFKGSGAPMKAKTGKKNEEKDVVKYTMICSVTFKILSDEV